MLGLGAVLGAPARGLLFVFREVEKAARQELEQRGDAVRAQLSALYLQLESGAITETEFDAQETDLLDLLDRIEAADASEESDESDDEDQDDGE